MTRALVALAALLLAAPAASAQSGPALGRAAAPAASPKFIGSWAGTLKAGENEIDVTLNIAPSDAGMQLYVDIPAQGVSGMQLPDTRIAGTSISFPGGNGRYDGVVNGAGTQITGKYVAGDGTEIGLTFTRTSATPTLPAIAAAVDDPTGLAGDFTGAIEAGAGLGASLHVRRIAEGYAVTLDVPAQQALGIPASAAAVTGDVLTATFPFGSYTGTFSADRTTLTGTWSQAGHDLPFNLTRD